MRLANTSLFSCFFLIFVKKKTCITLKKTVLTFETQNDIFNV